MNHAEVIALNKSANILEMSTIISAGGGKKKTCCNNAEVGLEMSNGLV